MSVGRERIYRVVLRWLYANGRSTDARIAEGIPDLGYDAATMRVLLHELRDERRVVEVTEAGDSEKHWIATENPRDTPDARGNFEAWAI